MSVALTPVITATTQWLLHAYPGRRGVLSTVLAETQARQAVTLAAWLRYPTALDVGLLSVGGPGGAGRLDALSGTEALAGGEGTADEPWRSWVDEILASWALSFLAAPELARSAADRAARSEHMAGALIEFRRLTHPDDSDLAATPLLRHPDLTGPVASLHRVELLCMLDSDDDLPEGASAPVP